MNNTIDYIKWLLQNIECEEDERTSYSKLEVRKMLLSIIGEIVTNLS